MHQKTRLHSTHSKIPLEANTVLRAFMTGELGHKAEMNTKGQHSTLAGTTHNQNSAGKAQPMCNLTKYLARCF